LQVGKRGEDPVEIKERFRRTYRKTGLLMMRGWFKVQGNFDRLITRKLNCHCQLPKPKLFLVNYHAV